MLGGELGKGDFGQRIDFVLVGAETQTRCGCSSFGWGKISKADENRSRGKRGSFNRKTNKVPSQMQRDHTKNMLSF